MYQKVTYEYQYPYFIAKRLIKNVEFNIYIIKLIFELIC